MAKAYPNSKIVGFDSHKPSIEWAKKQAEKEGLRNITFEIA
jgi:tRNA G46 methylase TrmB